jgi:hypothetical protein
LLQEVVVEVVVVVVGVESGRGGMQLNEFPPWQEEEYIV